MACNREEAKKAINLGKELYKSGDLDGAKRMFLKASSLDPSLLPKLKAAYDVQFAAATRKTPSGTPDWYAILQLDPPSDLETLKAQYKKLCLLTHPDKNCFAAAEGAFKLVNQAYKFIFELLSPAHTHQSSMTPSSSSAHQPGARPNVNNSHTGYAQFRATGPSSAPSATTGGGSNEKVWPNNQSGVPDSRKRKCSNTHQASASSQPQSGGNTGTTFDSPVQPSAGSAFKTGARPYSPQAVCPKCSGSCICNDYCGLAFRCTSCGLLAVRQEKGGEFVILIRGGNIDIHGGCKMAVNIHKVHALEVEGESSIYINRCDGVSIKGGSSVMVSRCDNVDINECGNVNNISC